MLKLLTTLIVLLIFLVIGMLFLIPSDFTRKNIDLSTGKVSKYYDINNNMLTPLLNTVSYQDPMVDTLAQRVQSSCQLMDNTCLTFETFKLLHNEITYNNTQERIIKFPSGTIRTGQGSDKDLTVLAASVLTSLDVPNYLVYNGQTYLNMVCKVPRDKLYKLIDQDINNNTLVNTELTLNRSEVWQANPEPNIVGNYQFKINASAPVTFALFLNTDLMSAYLSNKNELGLTTCIAEGQNISLTCTITSQRNTMIIIAGTKVTTVNLRMLDEKLLLGDLKTYNVKGEQCIPLDLSLQEGYAYPGRDDNNGKGLIIMKVPLEPINLQ